MTVYGYVAKYIHVDYKVAMIHYSVVLYIHNYLYTSVVGLDPYIYMLIY